MQSTINKTRFSIAESDYYFKEILVKSLKNNPFFQIIKNCNNGHELISQLYLKQEDIFLIDLYMPILSGIEAIKIIRQTQTETPILTYSATFQEDVFQYLDKIPNVYYCQKKSNVILDLINNYILNKCNDYTSYLDIWKQQPLEVKEYMNRQKKGIYQPSLVELQIMQLCYQGQSNIEIGQQLNLSSRTVDTYIAKLIQKLDLRNKFDLIRFCVEQGYYNSTT